MNTVWAIYHLLYQALCELAGRRPAGAAAVYGRSAERAYAKRHPNGNAQRHKQTGRDG